MTGCTSRVAFCARCRGPIATRLCRRTCIIALSSNVCAGVSPSFADRHSGQRAVKLWKFTWRQGWDIPDIPLCASMFRTRITAKNTGIPRASSSSTPRLHLPLLQPKHQLAFLDAGGRVTLPPSGVNLPPASLRSGGGALAPAIILHKLSGGALREIVQLRGAHVARRANCSHALTLRKNHGDSAANSAST